MLETACVYQHIAPVYTDIYVRSVSFPSFLGFLEKGTSAFQPVNNLLTHRHRSFCLGMNETLHLEDVKCRVPTFYVVVPITCVFSAAPAFCLVFLCAPSAVSWNAPCTILFLVAKI